MQGLGPDTGLPSGFPCGLPGGFPWRFAGAFTASVDGVDVDVGAEGGLLGAPPAPGLPPPEPPAPAPLPNSTTFTAVPSF